MSASRVKQGIALKFCVDSNDHYTEHLLLQLYLYIRLLCMLTFFFAWLFLLLYSKAWVRKKNFVLVFT